MATTKATSVDSTFITISTAHMTRLSPVLTALFLGLPLALYDFVLIDRKKAFLLAKAAFMLPDRLTAGDAVVFLSVFLAEILLLFLTMAVCLRGAGRTLGRHAVLAAAAFGAAYFIAVTIEFNVYQYFKEGLDLAMMRQLAGGSVIAAIRYIDAELRDFAPLLASALAVLAAGCWLLQQHAGRISYWLDSRYAVRRLTSFRVLAAANAVAIVLPPVLLAAFPRAASTLDYSLAHFLYSVPSIYLTDFDGDGYSMMTSPRDFAPFDSSRHPYAVDIPGNGIDEDGIGGDLPSGSWKAPMGAWDRAKLEPRSVLLIVLESARADLPDAEHAGSFVMPVLRGLNGSRFRLVSHGGLTIPSVCGMFNGSLAPAETGRSLINRFKDLGYQTAVVSAQDEDFGSIARLSGMRGAGFFFHAATAPEQQRMFPKRDPGVMAIPSRFLTARLDAWAAGADPRVPFFLYLNIQEMHFPYSYPGVRTVIAERPVPRRDILPENKEWVRLTYLDAARRADDALRETLAILGRHGLLRDTLIVIAGDHGEELFDTGSLGHGVSVTWAANVTFGELINSRWTPEGVVGSSDIPAVIYNSLVRAPEDHVPLDSEVLCYAGDPRKPAQIALVDLDGLLRYDFKRDRWLHQQPFASSFEPVQPDFRVVHRWEAWVYARLAGRSAE